MNILRKDFALLLLQQSTQNAVELEKTEDMITAAAPVQQNVSDIKDIEEVMKFINGGEDGAENPQNYELIKSKNKAAKRSRQKLRKVCKTLFSLVYLFKIH